jgi:histidyl-tRNA synthetase
LFLIVETLHATSLFVLYNCIFIHLSNYSINDPMSSKPSIPKGTRDFSTDEMLKREYIFETIKTVFRLYGYQPIETPAIENLSTLLGKYGEEGDKLLFRILNSGDFVSSITNDDLSNPEPSRLSSKICEKGLRYDLTVPFARYVVQHRDEIVFPFKRYQIQPVWRADRPQKGRYREFFQCDVDVIGSDSLLNELELIQIIDEVFGRLKVGVQIKVNNRKILSGIAEYAGIQENITDLTVALDKYEKIGWENVKEELLSKGINSKVINEFGNIVQVINKDNKEKLRFLHSILLNSKIGDEGIRELEKLFGLLEKIKISSSVVFDLTLARGLNYYTGAIIEVKSTDVNIGSICGGGRYDNLAGIFGLDGVSGVGVSFGADRIYDVMNQLNLFDIVNSSSTEVLVLNFGDTETGYGLKILDMLREMKVRAELYPDQVKLKKQMSYADSKKIPYIIIAGGDEINNNSVTIKIMSTGEQKNIPLNDLSSFVKEELGS